MTIPIPGIRQYLTSAYSDDELGTLCSDYFRDVYENFTAGMTKAQKIGLLLDYCQRRVQLPRLLAALERDRPQQYRERFAEVVKVQPPTLQPQRNPRQVFISHAHQDAEFAHRLAGDLQRNGWRVWIAPDSFRPGEKWAEAINRGLEESGVFVVALTPSAVASNWVKTETNLAIELAQGGEARFIPLLMSECKPPVLWRAFQQILFSSRYPAGLADLLAALEQKESKPQEIVLPQTPVVQTSASQPQPEPQLRPKWLWPAVGGLVGLVAIIAAVLIATLGSRGGSTPTPAGSDTAVALATLTPGLPTALPINTALEPTVTPLPTVTPTPTITPLPTNTSTPTNTPVVGGLGCTLRLTGPEGASATAEFPRSQVVINQQSSSIEVTWANLKLDSVSDADCVPDADTLKLVAEHAYHLVPQGTQTPAPIRPDENNAQLESVAGTKLLTLKKSFAVDALQQSAAPGEFNYTLEYQIEADKWEPVQGITLTLKWGMIAAVTPTATAKPTAWPLTASPTLVPPTAVSVLGVGSTATSPLDGMVLVYVPAGEFLMGSTDNDSEARSDEKPPHKVTLDAYWIDRTEVTKDQYQKCVDAGKCAAPSCGDTGQADHPVVCVNWQGAVNYCAWAGRRLPTEAEWEKAARGTDGRKYPWGNQGVAGDLLNFCDSNCGYNWKDNAVNDGYAGIAPVGNYPAGASPYGAVDMVGNVWEWVADWYGADYYASSVGSNPTGSASGRHRALRGGSFVDVQVSIRAAGRGEFAPGSGSDGIGFRCARSD